MVKSPDAFRTISEAAKELDVPQHVLRHWEEVFGQVRPMRRAGGRRYYRPLDIDLLRGIRVLLYTERFTTKGVQKIFKENGVKYVAELGRRDAAGESIHVGPTIDEASSKSGTGKSGTAKSKRKSLGISGLEAGDIETIPPKIRSELVALLTKLEKVRDTLDDAALALEAIDADDERDAPLLNVKGA